MISFFDRYIPAFTLDESAGAEVLSRPVPAIGCRRGATPRSALPASAWRDSGLCSSRSGRNRSAPCRASRFAPAPRALRGPSASDRGNSDEGGQHSRVREARPPAASSQFHRKDWRRRPDLNRRWRFCSSHPGRRLPIAMEEGFCSASMAANRPAQATAGVRRQDPSAARRSGSAFRCCPGTGESGDPWARPRPLGPLHPRAGLRRDRAGSTRRPSS